MRSKLNIILMIGVISMFSFCGCSDGFKYEKYSSKDPELNITMDYISDWHYSEQRGSYGSYVQVQFYEPIGPDKNLAASMIVTIKRSSKVKFKPLTVEAAVDDLLTKRLKFKDSKIISKSKVKLLKTEAWDIELAYKTLDKLYSVDAKLIPAKERIIIFKKDDKFYFLRYENTDEEFNKFNNAFNRVVKTLKFKNSQ